VLVTGAQSLLQPVCSPADAGGGGPSSAGDKTGCGNDCAPVTSTA